MSQAKWKYLITKQGQKVKVDAEDYDKVSKYTWHVIETGKTKKQSVVASIRTPKGVRQFTLGRFIMEPPKGKHVFPRRWQQGLDYRKNNLVVCTMAERQQMLGKQQGRKSSSKFKGVSYIPSKKVWRARIEVDGKSKFIGDFSTESEAARAYNKAARSHFGEFAYQNQIRTRSDRRK